jgi:hypothetical protein
MSPWLESPRKNGRADISRAKSLPAKRMKAKAALRRVLCRAPLCERFDATVAVNTIKPNAAPTMTAWMSPIRGLQPGSCGEGNPKSGISEMIPRSTTTSSATEYLIHPGISKSLIWSLRFVARLPRIFVIAYHLAHPPRHRGTGCAQQRRRSAFKQQRRSIFRGLEDPLEG